MEEDSKNIENYMVDYFPDNQIITVQDNGASFPTLFLLGRNSIVEFDTGQDKEDEQHSYKKEKGYAELMKFRNFNKNQTLP